MPAVTLVLVMTSWVLAMSGGDSRAQTPSGYVAIELPEPPGHDYTPVVAVDDRGVAVGSSRHAATWATTPLLWRDGQVETLPVPQGSTVARPSDINDRGVVVGTAYVQGWARPVMWAGGVVRVLPLPEGVTGYANGVNDVGEVVGWASRPGEYGRAVLWRRGELVPLTGPAEAGPTYASAINNRGQVGGHGAVREGGPPLVIRWDRGPGTTTVPHAVAFPADEVAITGVSERGLVVGFLWEGVAITWQGGAVQHLPSPSMAAVFTGGVNRLGAVVGSGYDVERQSRTALVWHDRVMTELVLPERLTGGWASDVNDAGVIVGHADRVDGSGSRGVMWAPAS
ncbi:hypothetical protein GCM10027194_15550 [Thalassiella azotivora]